MILKPYQDQAISKLLSRSKDLLAEGGPRKIVFKSPTGSGKTIVMADFLERLVQEQDLTSTGVSMIWAAPRKLHTQSKLKLQKIYAQKNLLKCSDFADLADLEIGPNEVLFLNWESINKTDSNTIIKENERDFYLSKVIENTKLTGRRLILVIDESHHHATSETSKQLISDMSPDLTIEVSATPVISDPDEIVSVSLDVVREQGMIKKSVILNSDFENVLSRDKVTSALSDGTDQFVLDQAIAKLAELKSEYKKLGRNINPLLLIQLPDRKSEIEDELKSDVIRHLEKSHGITVQNGKLAIYLSEEKEHIENIAKDDSPVEVMLFKQAIALGWDCPRAQILVLFRDHKSLTFSIQTVGRIMRMPEPTIGHYDSELLNQSFIYTNLADISINEDVAKGYITVHTSKRKDDYSAIELNSVYRLRQREKTRLAALFTSLFIQAAEEYDLASKIDIDARTINQDLISNVSASSVDELSQSLISGTFEVQVENEEELQRLFNFYVRDALAPFYPEERSVGRLKESIYKFFDSFLFIDYASNFSKIIQIVLSDKNRLHMSNVIDIAKGRYSSAVDSRADELTGVASWEVPKALSFPGDFKQLNATKSVMQPFFFDDKWKSEASFISFLDSSDSVEWWFKNGERDATFFAVAYEDHGDTKPFYVDFIVKMKDGRIGLFDTKSGSTVDGAKTRSAGLQEYISQNPKTWGGIVTNSNGRDYSGRWLLFTGEAQALDSADLANWQTLEL
jgi:type III restriction enzyme